MNRNKYELKELRRPFGDVSVTSSDCSTTFPKHMFLLFLRTRSPCDAPYPHLPTGTRKGHCDRHTKHGLTPQRMRSPSCAGGNVGACGCDAVFPTECVRPSLVPVHAPTAPPRCAECASLPWRTSPRWHRPTKDAVVVVGGRPCPATPPWLVFGLHLSGFPENDPLLLIV